MILKKNKIIEVQRQVRIGMKAISRGPGVGREVRYGYWNSELGK